MHKTMVANNRISTIATQQLKINRVFIVIYKQGINPITNRGNGNCT